MSEETTTEAVPAGRDGLVATAARSAGARVAAGVDRVDLVVLAGLVLLGVGLALWWSLGVALSVVGALVFVVGIAAALPAAAAGEPDAQRRGAGS
ncbi:MULTISPECIES: hypothetical protein [unclassified Micromonospora]|uniref:hypothetical protein n=1 Tax=unclassified Micromonospora TaxID=2617518 RepID=UPI002FF0E9E6